MSTDVLLVGAGDLGAAVGLRLASLGHDVLALRRNAALVPAPLTGRSVDLTREAPDLAGVRPRFVVVALTARPRTEEAYRATYVDGMARALDALEVAPERAVLVSSTAVMPSSEQPPLDDESTPAAPSDGPGRMLLAAEAAFHERIPHGTVLRLSGPVRRLEHAAARPGPRREDHRSAPLDQPDPPRGRGGGGRAPADDGRPPGRPLPRHRRRARAARRRGGVPRRAARRTRSRRPPTPTQGHGKRLSNARLRATGWTPTRPSYREGYADLA